MKTKNQKLNKGPVSRATSQGGFTLVEALFAIFILSFAISVLMSVVAKSLFSAKYARDEITANYLAQEVIDYIRNDRDTTVFLQSSEKTDQVWSNFKTKYVNCSTNDNGGCSLDVSQKGQEPEVCSVADCPLYFNENATGGSFYSYTPNGTPSKFKRKIIFDGNPMNQNEVYVKVTVTWLNGSVPKTRVLETSLLNWQQ